MPIALSNHREFGPDAKQIAFYTDGSNIWMTHVWIVLASLGQRGLHTAVRMFLAPFSLALSCFWPPFGSSLSCCPFCCSQCTFQNWIRRTARDVMHACSACYTRGASCGRPCHPLLVFYCCFIVVLLLFCCPFPLSSRAGADAPCSAAALPAVGRYAGGWVAGGLVGRAVVQLVGRSDSRACMSPSINFGM